MTRQIYNDHKINDHKHSDNKHHDHTAAYAEAFFIGNLLFVGAFYLALWILYFLRYDQASAITKYHLKQALIASSISTAIFISINIFIILTTGYASVTALFSLEFYFMLLLPLFLVVGILAFTKAIKGINFDYPLISRFIESPAIESSALESSVIESSVIETRVTQ